MVSMETVPTPRNKPINATCKRREQAAREPEGTGGPRRERRVRGSWAVEQNRRGRRLRGAGKGGPRGGATAPGREKGGLWRSERDKESRRGASVGRPAPQRPGGGLRTGTRAPRALALPTRGPAALCPESPFSESFWPRSWPGDSAASQVCLEYGGEGTHQVD